MGDAVSVVILTGTHRFVRPSAWWVRRMIVEDASVALHRPKHVVWIVERWRWWRRGGQARR